MYATRRAGLGELWRRTRIQYVRHVFASSFTSVSRDFGLELGARQGFLEALVGSWVFAGLRASPIVLRPEISHLLVILPAAFVPRKLREICPGERACCRSSCANAALMRPRIVKLAAASPETVH